jgi:hypothetical protein
LSVSTTHCLKIAALDHAILHRSFRNLFFSEAPRDLQNFQDSAGRQNPTKPKVDITLSPPSGVNIEANFQALVPMRNFGAWVKINLQSTTSSSNNTRPSQSSKVGTLEAAANPIGANNRWCSSCNYVRHAGFSAIERRLAACERGTFEREGTSILFHSLDLWQPSRALRDP